MLAGRLLTTIVREDLRDLAITQTLFWAGNPQKLFEKLQKDSERRSSSRLYGHNPLDFDTLHYSIGAGLAAKRAYRDQRTALQGRYVDFSNSLSGELAPPLLLLGDFLLPGPATVQASQQEAGALVVVGVQAQHPGEHPARLSGTAQPPVTAALAMQHAQVGARVKIQPERPFVGGWIADRARQCGRLTPLVQGQRIGHVAFLHTDVAQMHPGVGMAGVQAQRLAGSFVTLRIPVARGGISEAYNFGARHAEFRRAQAPVGPRDEPPILP